MSRENVIFIGFMGAGKTSVGRAYARAADIPLVDTDQMIEEEAGMTISDIFRLKGEEFFRETETAVLKKLQKETEPKVISVGGGLPLREENRAVLRELGQVIFLQVKAETVIERLKGDTTRPLLQGPDVRQRAEELLAYRNPIYRQAAHQIVDVDGKTVEEIVNLIRAKEGTNR